MLEINQTFARRYCSYKRSHHSSTVGQRRVPPPSVPNERSIRKAFHITSPTKLFFLDLLTLTHSHQDFQIITMLMRKLTHCDRFMIRLAPAPQLKRGAVASEQSQKLHTPPFYGRTTSPTKIEPLTTPMC